MSLKERLILLAQALATDTKALFANVGSLAGLNTAAKTSLVDAINEVVTTVSGAAVIDDAALSSVTDKTYSANKIVLVVDTAIAAVVGSAPEMLNALNEFAAALANDPEFATTMMNDLANRVRVDVVQNLTDPQKIQARDNIGAASSVDLGDLVTSIGDVNYDLVAAYLAARA